MYRDRNCPTPTPENGMKALRDEQGTAASKDSSHQTMMIKRNILV